MTGGTSDDDDLFLAAADEFAARYRRGERPTVEEYAARHPSIADRVRALFPAMVEIERAAGDDDDGGAAATEVPGRAAPLEGPGAVVGRYRLLERIGEGGFGVVYMAEQQHPVRRRVAVKVIKPGLDTRQVVARFEAERQALALMDHENIARVLDAGTTDAGRPYFVMELVRGVPITTYCDDHRLDPRRRLALFVAVCRAVQHAHTKGVIHRDIKPSNVLVTTRDDGGPVPKVIDFGVAKATGPLYLTDLTLFTNFAQMVGTPLYMSPEQAAMTAAADVDTRSDVYSLGVLLYELLTGSTPFDRERLRRAAHDEVRRIIREEEPPRPSTRLGSSASLASIAALRATEPRRLSGIVRGELDWIVMRALEKDRGRRYETAISFAHDVERYLNDEPVVACPPSRAYRVRKLIRRNRGPVAAVCVVVLALVAGLAGTAWQAARANRAKHVVERERDAKQAAVVAEAEARRRAVAALASLTDGVVERQLARGPVLDAADRAFLRSIMAHYEAFAATRGETPDARAARADGHFRVAQLQAGLGEAEPARASYGRAIELFAALAAERPDVRAYRHMLTGARCNLASLLRTAGDRDAAEAEYRRALETGARLVEEDPTVPAYRRNLAVTHNGLGIVHSQADQLAAAEAAYRAAMALREELVRDDPGGAGARADLAASHGSLGNVLKRQGRLAEAEASYRAALGVQRELHDGDPGAPGHRRDLATTHRNLADLLVARAGPNAERHYRDAIDVQRRLAADFPVVPQYRKDLGDSYAALGRCLARQKKYGAAADEYRSAIEVRRSLATNFPDVPDYRFDLATAYHSLGHAIWQTGRGGPAPADAYREAAQILAGLVADYPGVATYRQRLGVTRSALGSELAGAGKRPDAIAQYHEAIALQRALLAEFPSVPQYAADFGGTCCNLGNALRGGGRPDEALEWYARAIGALGPFAATAGAPAQARAFLRNSHWARAEALEALGRSADAVADWDRAIELDDGSAGAALRRGREASAAKTGGGK